MPAECFADDPVHYFGNDAAKVHSLSRQHQEELQLAALRIRFAAMRDAIVPLKALADASRIDEIRALADAAELLLPHSMFKSYPSGLLEDLRFDALTEWLGRITLNDLSGAAGRSFDSIDAWMGVLDADTGLEILHSSGTTGALSLYPRGKQEMRQQKANFGMLLPEWIDAAALDPSGPGFAVVWPAFATGRSALLKGGDFFREVVAASPGLFFALTPTAMSTDWHHFAMRMRDAAENRVPGPRPSAYVRARLREADAFGAENEARYRFLLDVIRQQKHERPVIIAGGPINLHRLSETGLAAGMEAALAPGSAVRSFGGLKGHAEPDGMERTIMRFTGVGRIANAYGMTELTSHFNACGHDHYHIQPWLIPFVLDPATGGPLPRHGRQRGRAAFMDLLPRTYWGGVVSADFVEIDWDPCACGRTTPHIAPAIARIGDVSGPDSLSANGAAVRAALQALNAGIG